jgi:hypothetical protein
LQQAFNGIDGQLMAVFTAERVRHPDLANAFHTRFVAQRQAHLRRLVRNAVARGELPEDTDVELIAEVGPAIMLHQFVQNGGRLRRDLADRIVRQFLP